MTIRHDWTLEQLRELHALPLFQLISQAHQIHLKFHKPGEVQVCQLISVKTGGCPEDCKYCAQSSRYQTPARAQPMMSFDDVMKKAIEAVSRGATRVCLGAAWREVRDNKPFEEVLKMIKGITALGMEVCCTLGMLSASQANRLKQAGLYAYNHNLDSSEAFYKTIITSRTYQQRLDTLNVVEETGLQVCCGGIIGMGETIEDRLELLRTLSSRTHHPESVPINRLSTIPGTPLSDQPPLSDWEMIRMISIARIALPRSMIRLSSGRIEMSLETQALCFFAGANSIFSGEKLLTVANTSIDQDEKMFEILGLTKRAAFG